MTGLSSIASLPVAADTAWLFPGQGAQAVGMGRDLAEQIPAARAIFDAADAALGVPLSRVCFEGPEAELTLTANTQPAILTVSTIAGDALSAAGVRPAFVAGHSLGEYSALVSAGALAFGEAVRTVRARGEFMQEAVPAGEGAMAAVIGLDPAAVQAACAEAQAAGAVQVANLNAPGQTVISGDRQAVQRAIQLAKAKGAKRALPLPVSAPFHSALMEPAARRLEAVLKEVAFRDLQVPVVTNVEAAPLTDGSAVRDSLLRQVTAPVRWEDVVRRLVAEGVETFIEVGPGKVLCGLIRRIAPEARTLNVEDRASLEATVEALQ
jgi:[acyl-carrier-protein] S-malonyltransferase